MLHIFLCTMSGCTFIGIDIILYKNISILSIEK